MAAVDDLLLRLQEVHFHEYDRIERGVLARALAMWKASPDYRDTNIEVLAKKLEPLIKHAAISVANAEAAFLAKTLTLQTGSPVAAAAVETAVIYATVPDWTDRLSQPAIAMRTELSRGSSVSDAIEYGGRNLGFIIRQVMADTRATQATASLTHSGIKRFRRTVSGTACKRCRRIIGSGQKTYAVGTGGVKPLHPSCNCGYVAFVLVLGTQADADTTNAATAARNARYAEARARKTDPELQRAYLKDRLRINAANVAALEKRWAGIDDMPLEQRQVGRRQLGIAQTNLRRAQAALA